jgi:enamine deaminase RidA (YjgF/YER057c/UK114 family)
MHSLAFWLSHKIKENEMKRLNISSGAPWESIVGYSRAVRMGPYVHVAGTTASDENGRVIGEGDPYAQANYIFNKIEAALNEAGAALTDVVRTRMFVVDVTHWEAIGKAHGERFANIRPAATLIEVSRLISPELLVEIEVDAILLEELSKPV